MIKLRENVRDMCHRSDSLVVMYVGNLESYQGIDLLLNSFALALKVTDRADLIIIGGETSDIQKYTQLSLALGISDRVHFLGPRPVDALSDYLSQADILASPRIKGKNTPMKIYSYLGSGKAVIATNLETHTQVLTDQISMLAAPTPDAFSRALVTLIQNSHLRLTLGGAGKQLIQENFSLTAFKKRANSLLDWVQEQITTTDKPSTVQP